MNDVILEKRELREILDTFQYKNLNSEKSIYYYLLIIFYYKLEFCQFKTRLRRYIFKAFLFRLKDEKLSLSFIDSYVLSFFEEEEEQYNIWKHELGYN